MSEYRDEIEDATAQDVVDALRLAYVAQDDSQKRADLTDALLDFAPETDSNRGVQLLIRLIAEGSLAVSLKSAPTPPERKGHHPE